MKNFIITFFISSFILTICFVGLITAIDPYDKLGNNFFNFETKAVAQSRENKFYLLDSSPKPYDAFIIGSSAAHRYPTKKLNELTGLTSYNYAVQHSTPLDYLAITRHILSKFNPKLIMIQLDFAALDENYKVDNRLYNSPLKSFIKDSNSSKKMSFLDDNPFTLDALRDSFRVIFVNLFGEARHIYLEDGNYRFEKEINIPIRIVQGNHSNYKYSKKRLRILKDIQKLCDKNNIKLVILSAPIAHSHLSLIKNDRNLSKVHTKFITDLENNFKNFHNFQNEKIKEYNDSTYFLDSIHLSKKLSEIILDKVFKK